MIKKQEKLVLFGTSQFTTPHRVLTVDSARSWTQSDANNFLIIFFYFIVWSNINGINDASLWKNDSGINVIS